MISKKPTMTKEDRIKQKAIDIAVKRFRLEVKQFVLLLDGVKKGAGEIVDVQRTVKKFEAHLNVKLKLED